MKVILIFTYGISILDWSRSGILRREMELYDNMGKKFGIEYTFITYNNEVPKEIQSQYRHIKIYPAYKFINYKNNKYLNFFNSFLLPFKIRKKVKSYDLIKTNQLNGAWVALILKILIKKPLYIRTGYNLFEFSIRDKKPLYIKFFHYILTQLSLIISNLYSVSSKEDKKYIEKYFLRSKNIIIIPNWVNNIQENSFENRYDKKILSIGRLEKQKNYESLIHSIGNSEFELDLIGSGSKKELLEKLAKDVNAKVNFLGNVSYEKLMTIYKKYRVFVIPSNFEGNPKVVLEAMANGCLVIGRENKNINEIIKHNLNGILYNSNDNLLEIIESVIRNKTKFEMLTEEGYEYILNTNHIDKIIKIEQESYKYLAKS